MVWSVVTPWLWADTRVEQVSPGGVTMALTHTVEPGDVMRPSPGAVLIGGAPLPMGLSHTGEGAPPSSTVVGNPYWKLLAGPTWLLGNPYRSKVTL